MSADYNGLTRNTWPGTWSPSSNAPIVLDTEVRGTLQSISGASGDKLTDIPGQRIQEGMLVWLKNGYTSGLYTRTSATYYTYTLGLGESRNASTGAVPNAESNWSEPSLGSPAFDGIISATTDSTSTTTGALTVAGGVGIQKNVNIGGRVTAESLRIAESVLDSTQTLVNTTAQTIIDTYSTSEYRGAKYLIQIDEGTGPSAHFLFIEMLLIVDNAGDIWKTEYAQLTTNGNLGVFSADVVGGNLELYFTPYAATSKTINVLRTAMIK
jgi:hypothetical protein